MKLEWRKSSYSGAQNNCVEVAPVREGAAVRDSKDSAGPELRFPVEPWRAFIGAVKSGSIST
jgi:hypothetical protein